MEFRELTSDEKVKFPKAAVGIATVHAPNLNITILKRDSDGNIDYIAFDSVGRVPWDSGKSPLEAVQNYLISLTS